MKWLAAVLARAPSPLLRWVRRARWRFPWLNRVLELIADQLRGRDAIIAQGVGRGLRFNVAGANAGYILGTSEPEVQQALRILLQPGMTMYDVGANVGFFAVIAARLVGPSGTVVCFEPLEENAQQIAHNASLNSFGNVVVRPEALGKSDTQAQFLLSQLSTSGRLAGTGPVNQPVGATTVTVRSLDSAIPDLELPLPDLIKLDAEGAEAGVLMGARNTLASERPLLIVELHGTNREVLAALEPLRYRVGVLGNPTAPEAAPWTAHLVALPDERDDLAAMLSTLTSTALFA